MRWEDRLPMFGRLFVLFCHSWQYINGSALDAK